MANPARSTWNRSPCLEPAPLTAGQERFEIRNPQAEIRKKSDGRNPRPGGCPDGGGELFESFQSRGSVKAQRRQAATVHGRAFGFLSGLELRTSDFQPPISPSPALRGPRGIALLLLLATVIEGGPHGQLAAQAAPGTVAIRFVPGPPGQDPVQVERIQVEVLGLTESALTVLRQLNWPPARWQRLLSFRVQPENKDAGAGWPAMAGEYRVTATSLTFIPQFSLTPGLRYQAAFAPAELPGAIAAGSAGIAAEFRARPRAARSTTHVSNVYPSGDVLPENLLKFYLHFSAPMSRGHIYHHIHLREESGREIELPFLEIDEELWDPSMQRLTLFIDPGRIKRGVQPLEEVGPALESGRRYRWFWIAPGRMPRATHCAERFRKSFAWGRPTGFRPTRKPGNCGHPPRAAAMRLRSGSPNRWITLSPCASSE